MRPGILFQDEAKLYFQTQVDQELDSADCLLIVGSSLGSDCIARIAANFLKRELPVIEINAEPRLKVGHTFQVQGLCEEVLPSMLEAFKSVKTNQKVTTKKWVASDVDGSNQF